MYTSDHDEPVICPEIHTSTLIYVLQVKKSKENNVSYESDFKTPRLFELFNLYRQVNRTLAYTSIFIRAGFVVM